MLASIHVGKGATLAKKLKQNRPIPQWIRMRTGNRIRCASLAPTALLCLGRTFRVLARLQLLCEACVITNLLTQSPAPTGPSFDVSYDDPTCGRYRLMGTFSDSDNFSGLWMTTFSGGSCLGCPGQNASVIGARR